MSRIQCKGCNYKPSEHDTLQGYCMLCAEEKIKKSELLEVENKKLRHEIVGWMNWTYYLPKDWVPKGLIDSSKKALKDNV